MRRILFLLFVISCSFLIIRSLNNKLIESKLNYINSLDKNEPPAQAVNVVPMYPTFEPPAHPQTSDMLNKVDKKSIDPQELNWVKFSDMWLQFDTDVETFSFDFNYPNNYFMLNPLTTTDKDCAELLGKGMVGVITFCEISNENDVMYYLEEMSNPIVATIKNYKTYTADYYNFINIFPTKQMIIIRYNERNEFEEAALFIIPVVETDSFKPNDLQAWNAYKIGYDKDLEITQMILDSFYFN